VANQVVTALCDTAWTVRCQVGAELARSLGGSGELAKMQSSPRVQLDFLLQFAQDEGYDPPQGSVQLVRPSTRFSQSGFWKVTATDDADTPSAVQWRLRLEQPLEASGVGLVPAGDVYFSAKVDLDAFRDEARSPAADALVLTEGRVTVKEDIGINTGIFNARGILAEFKIVGDFEMRGAPNA